MPPENSCTHDAKEVKHPAARVYYDGGCPLCRREIEHYRRLHGAGRLEWVDIDREDTRLPGEGPSKAEAMARMHVQDAFGNWHTGAWAFAEMWSHLPNYRRLAGFLRATRALPVLDRAYSIFARWRLKRRCSPAACGELLPRGGPRSVSWRSIPQEIHRAVRRRKTMTPVPAPAFPQPPHCWTASRPSALRAIGYRCRERAAPVATTPSCSWTSNPGLATPSARVTLSTRNRNGRHG